MGTPTERPIVLVVEDDAVVRSAAVETLEGAGFEAHQAGNGNEAIRHLDRTDGVRVVLTDIDMPLGIDGIKLAACIHRRWPRIGIVITSGKIRPEPGDVPARGQFIPKPYTEAAILAAIRGLMA
ncbi:response regulator [Methylobacterium organophilum]|uniref:Sensor kinase CckA n=1 Tax=Methylobacterium organophilum TaxID=410 RepID=A0ABQ4T8Y4_METOR|nr:response regulator [Methylobacterium organophilum]GJE27064.1 Sensor kinase CckA [Methylobacterium organophilum]